MKYWILITLAILVLITAQADRIKFEQDKELLEKCIEHHLSSDSGLKIGKSVETIAEIVSYRFCYRSFETEREFKQATNNLYYSIRDGKYHLFTNNSVPDQLRMSIRNALENCVERQNLPRFANEPRVLTELLDFVLVDWLIPPSFMILTQQGRSILRLYAYSAGVRLMSALRYFSMNFDAFHHELLRIWMLRAQQFYDGRGAGIPYIRHRFTTNVDRIFSAVRLEDIHMIDNLNSYMCRGLVDFEYRNPLVGRRNSNATLAGTYRQRYYIHPYGVTSAENYLETHMDQCYGIIFFVLELQRRGINTDEDDHFDGSIPSSLVPSSISDILRTGGAHRTYIVSLRDHYKQFSKEGLEDYFSSGAVEELIILLVMSLVTTTRSTGTISTNVSSITTTTISTSTEFPGYEDGSNKGGVRDKDFGKYFLPNRRFRTISCEQNKQQPRQTDTNHKIYGYIVYNGDSNELRLLEKNHFILTTIFAGLTL